MWAIEEAELAGWDICHVRWGWNVKQLSTGSFHVEGTKLGAVLVNGKDAEGIHTMGIYPFACLLLQVASCESFLSTCKLGKTD